MNRPIDLYAGSFFMVLYRVKFGSNDFGVGTFPRIKDSLKPIKGGLPCQLDLPDICRNSHNHKFQVREALKKNGINTGIAQIG